MPESAPLPISPAEKRSRLQRIRRIAKKLGFQGEVEYRHVLSGTGGAQYGIGISDEQDLLVVFAEAFFMTCASFWREFYDGSQEIVGNSAGVAPEPTEE